MWVIEDTPPILKSLTPEQIWARPGGSASIGFHIVHMCGSLDRLFTYSRGESLSTEQQRALAAERIVDVTLPSMPEILRLLISTVDSALQYLPTVPPNTLHITREVGRARLPSTTLGLLFHAAEHSLRHAGQVVTLAKVVQGG